MNKVTQIGAVGIEEILKHIPHRYPFLLVDRVEDGEASKWIRVVKNVTHTEEYLVKSRNQPSIMPRMLLIEAFAQCAGVLCHFSGLSKPYGQTLTFFAGIDKCRFLGDAKAGDRIVFECYLERAMRGVVKLSGHGSAANSRIIELLVTAVLRDRDMDRR